MELQTAFSSAIVGINHRFSFLHSGRRVTAGGIQYLEGRLCGERKGVPGREGAKTMKGAPGLCRCSRNRKSEIEGSPSHSRAGYRPWGCWRGESPGDWVWEYCWDQTFDLSLGPSNRRKPHSCLPKTFFKASWAGSIQMLETGRAPECSASHLINHTKTPNFQDLSLFLCPSLSTQLHRKPLICINFFLASTEYMIILKPFGPIECIWPNPNFSKQRNRNP